MKLYVAYGSNLNKRQMKKRCPKSSPVTTGILKDWTLIYRGESSGTYATIQKQTGAFVPVALWEIHPEDEKALDEYEAYPSLYGKYDITVTLEDGSETTGMVYIMTEDAVPGQPSEEYIQAIREGYADYQLDLSVFETSLK